MRVKLSPLIDDARGAIGNMVFSMAKAGQHYVRSKAAIACNPRSALQQAFRCHTSWLSHEWTNTLTPAERSTWEEFAQKNARRRVDINQGGGHTNLIPRGRGIMSGFNAYIGINQRLRLCTGEATELKEEAPVGLPPYIVEAISASWDGVGEDIDIAWDYGNLGVDFTQPMVRIWLESYAAGAHKQLVACVDASGDAHDLANARYALGITAPIVDHPGLYRLQLDVLIGDEASASGGLVSPPSEILEVIVP